MAFLPSPNIWDEVSALPVQEDDISLCRSFYTEANILLSLVLPSPLTVLAPTGHRILPLQNIEQFFLSHLFFLCRVFSLIAMDSEWKDFKMAIFFAIAFLVARFALHVFVYQKLANWLLGGGTGSSLKLAEAKQVKIAKCCESMWKFTYYTTVQACVLSITYHESWFRDKQEFFKGWPNQDLKFSLRIFYMCQCGFYIYSIAALLAWETRRKDFSIMMSHHIITVCLIGFSYVTRFFRIGSIILALHDASDVFMEAAKLFKYCEKELAASVFFGFFAISWFILRLIIFPFWVIWGSSYDSVQYLPLNEVNIRVLYYLFNTMLLTLLVFHLYWWFLIYSMILRQLKNRGKVGEDIRSDSEDED